MWWACTPARATSACSPAATTTPCATLAKYDGRLGVLAAMAVVARAARERHAPALWPRSRGLCRGGRPALQGDFLGSSALTGHFDPAWLEQRDADGVSMREAMRAGLPGRWSHRRLQNATRPLPGFVEVHMRAPCSTTLTRRSASSPASTAARYLGRYLGVASHAGTTPMNRRRDAARGGGRAHALRRESRGR